MERLIKRSLPPTNRQPDPQPGLPSNPGPGSAFAHLPAGFPRLAFFTALLIAGVNLAVTLLVEDTRFQTAVSDAAGLLIELSACLILFWAAAKTAAHSKGLAVAWSLIAVSILFSTLGGTVWFILEVVLKVDPFPSIADVLYLAYYPLSLTGLLFLLDGRATVGEMVTRGLDILIIFGVAVLGFWYFLIEPVSALPSGQSVLEQSILLAYPAGDLMLAGALLLFLYAPHKKQNSTPVLFLMASLLLSIVSDSIFGRRVLSGAFFSGELLDSGWIASSSLVGLAGLSQFESMKAQKTDSAPVSRSRLFTRLSSIRSYLPYFILATVFILLGPPEARSALAPPAVTPLLAGRGVLLLLVVIRQILALRENDRLTARLMESNRKLELDIAERERVERAGRQSEAMFRTLFELSPDAIMILDPNTPDSSWPIVDCNREACRMNGYSREELIGKSIDIINLTPGDPEERKAFLKAVREKDIYKLEAQHRRKNGERFYMDVTTTVINVGGRDLIVGIDHDITDRKRKEGLISHRLVELEAINRVSSTLRTAQTLEEMLSLLMDATLEAVGASQGSIWLYDPAKEVLNPEVVRGYEGPAVDPGRRIAEFIFAGGKPLISGDLRELPGLPEEVRHALPAGVGGAALPIYAEQDVIGTLIVNVPPPRELTPDETRLLTTLSEIAGIAIRRISLSQQTARRLQRLTALSEISRSITSSVSLQLNLSMLLNQVVTQLGIDAADVLLMNPVLGTLEYAAGKGFRARAVEPTRQKVGEGYAGRAAMERRIVHIDSLSGRDDGSLLTMVAGESFVTYFAVPLIAKGQVQGVLEIFHRTQREHDAEWLAFLYTLAEQAAIAIDNANMFENLQRTNLNLVLAYDATIEGWSRALDLRDRETEGHTQRVTDLTIRLARLFGLGESELNGVRWGALLHDIGKMGVPDDILLKPGPLSDAEWVIMKQHPGLAYEMLLPIQYLRAALDIPHYHHEKWDGTGYPDGLKGEQIPLTARIFAVVDVWDALSSNRPYRSAWPAPKVREHIRSLTGIQFDPKIAERFLQFEGLEDLEG